MTAPQEAEEITGRTIHRDVSSDMTTMSFELDRIEELCQIRGWSHYRLAKEMDVSPNSIGNLFRRTSIPSIPTIRHICEAMGITISQFYGTDGAAAILTEQQMAFLEMFDRLSPGDKKKAEGYIEGLLAKSQSERVGGGD